MASTRFANLLVSINNKRDFVIGSSQKVETKTEQELANPITNSIKYICKDKFVDAF
jgi:hypothetical protein